MIQFSSMPNFRKLTKEGEESFEDTSEETRNLNTNFNNINQFNLDDRTSNGDSETVTSHRRKMGKIYRSSRPDFLTAEEVEQFEKINFKCIIDFRSHSEYKKSYPLKLIDQHYSIYKVKLPFWRTYKPLEQVQVVRVQAAESYSNKTAENSKNLPEKKHFLINFFNLNYIWHVFNRVPFMMRIVSIFYLFFDIIMRTDKRHFVRFFAQRTLNKQGLAGQYVDIINYSQASICAALKLLCDPVNIPAMLNCAHGKDRTGIVSALLLGCLGCSPEYICADYAKSAIELRPIQELLVKDIVDRFHMCKSFVGAESETMKEILEYIDTNYGGVTSYLEKIGFSIAEQQQLRKNLL